MTEYTTIHLDLQLAEEMFTDLRDELGDQEAMRQVAASYQIPNSYQESIVSKYKKQDDVGSRGGGNFYFVIYDEGKTAITIIDISQSARHERGDWEAVNNEDFYDRDDAIVYARKLAEKYNLKYTPFTSRYNKDLNEVGDALSL